MTRTARTFASAVVILSASLLYSPPARAAGAAPAPACKVNVATASIEQLALLPGVGPKTAALIFAAKPKDEAALDAVKGIGPAKLAGMRPFVSYAGPTTCKEKQKAPEKQAGLPAGTYRFSLDGEWLSGPEPSR